MRVLCTTDNVHQGHVTLVKFANRTIFATPAKGLRLLPREGLGEPLAEVLKPKAE